MAMPSIGAPTMLSTIIRSGMEPPGTPAAPIDTTTDIRTTRICSVSASSIPKTWAMKSTVTPSKSAVPSMFMVAPSGTTKPATSFGTPSFSSATRSVVGSVALLDEVEKAVTMTIQASWKNAAGLRPATNFSASGYTTAMKRPRPAMTVTT